METCTFLSAGRAILAMLAFALLAGCATSHSERCRETCFSPAADSDLIPIQAGSTPVFAVAGAMFVKATAAEGGWSTEGGGGEGLIYGWFPATIPTKGGTAMDWTGTDVQRVMDGIAGGLHRTAGVETLTRPAAAAWLAPLAPPPTASETDQASASGLPDELAAPQLAASVWGDRTSHLVFFLATIDRNPLKLGPFIFAVGGGGGIAPGFGFGASRAYALSLSAKVYERATGRAVSHLSITDKTAHGSAWLFFVLPIPNGEPGVSHVLDQMSQRIGEEFGRRFRLVATPSLPTQQEAANAGPDS